MAKYLHMKGCTQMNDIFVFFLIKINIMASIEFGGSGNKDRNHKCYTEQKGDWIIFRCHQCPDYERRMHLKTGKMKFKNNSEDSGILHNGFFVQPGFDYQPN